MRGCCQLARHTTQDEFAQARVAKATHHQDIGFMLACSGIERLGDIIGNSHINHIGIEAAPRKMLGNIRPGHTSCPVICHDDDVDIFSLRETGE